MLVLEDITQKNRSARIADWYEKVFPKVGAYIKRQGGSLEEAKELFQEALVIYFEKISGGNFQPDKSDDAYLFGMVKHLWFKHLQTQQQWDDLDPTDTREELTAELRVEKLVLLLKQSGQRCLELLQSFYYERLSMQKVSERFGYKSERSATVQKYKCLEKLRAEVKDKSLNYEDFLD
ncbi:MAG TPA: RNA polymerase subunit sigma-70 [Cytophagales bacterium]|nr:RNA polymerase subunit sigma-70 [Cytophagales bacterium]HAA17781.1 RNA polymerase subunit sigma-70 [Cytophagales bacterium]HAP59843.1 RNA polymerase subunit sigma-70 [Cytophagales bacterium]